jgi:hypothetical protein
MPGLRSLSMPRHARGRYTEDLESKQKLKNARNDQPRKASQGEWRVVPRERHLVAAPAPSTGHPAQAGVALNCSLLNRQKGRRVWCDTTPVYLTEIPAPNAASRYQRRTGLKTVRAGSPISGIVGLAITSSRRWHFTMLRSRARKRSPPMPPRPRDWLSYSGRTLATLDIVERSAGNASPRQRRLQ